MRRKDKVKSELILYVKGNDNWESCGRSWGENQLEEHGQAVTNQVQTAHLIQTSLRPNVKTGEEEDIGHLDALHIWKNCKLWCKEILEILVD